MMSWNTLNHRFNNKLIYEFALFMYSAQSQCSLISKNTAHSQTHLWFTEMSFS